MKKLLILSIIIVFLAILIKVESYTESTIYCEDADTLIESITVYVGENSSTLTLPTYCSWGCDNTTLRCSPNPFEQNLIFIGLSVGFMLIIFFIWKFK